MYLIRMRKQIGRGTTLSVARPQKLKKYHLDLDLAEAFHGKNSSSFKVAFKQLVKKAFFEVYNFFLGQLA